jgi:two-component system chemotaxis response regulator CheY
MSTAIYQVLICDDSMLIRKKMREILEKMDGIEILEAVNGREAVLICKDKQVSLVFLDIIMPEQDGIEALIEIKQLDPSIYIIMASSVGTESNLRKAIKAGADDFIQKPITPESVDKIITKYMRRKEEQNV